MSDSVRYEVDRGVAWLTIDRPQARNALNREVRDGLFAAELAEADRIWEPVYRSADAQEGPRAFRDKRRPTWTGR
jgi:enoyl-CoA hydratase/carnithine racemase